MTQLARSLPAADYARLGEALRRIKEAGASMVHVDVMDGHFVPELTLGQPVVRCIRKATDLILDLHLLVERPERYVQEFIGLGADRIAVHAEATANLHHALEMIRAGGVKAGVALNPATALESATSGLPFADYLLLLSASLGFGSGRFLPEMLAKVEAACSLRRQEHLEFAVQVEGGITAEHVEALGQAGADILVTDSAIFSNLE